ncbi:MAG: hypothetical protein RLY71_4605, partial [Pseudomonadota bacterium]
MQLPAIAPGKRYALPRPPGSADALLLARHAQALIDKAGAKGRDHKDGAARLAVVCAEPADAQRLADEIAFFAPELKCAVFPDWETLPYDSFSPHQDLISERLATLWRVLRGTGDERVDVLLLPATTALTRLAPPSFLAAYTFSFKARQKLDEAALKSQLTLAGYQHVSQVVSPGEYAVRGSLIDLFPMGSLVPYRVDLFDDEIDSIRTFDPDTQRSLYPVPAVRLLPGREFPLDETARTGFRARWRERIEGDPTKARIYKDIGTGVAAAGIEYYLPLFFDQTATLFDYLGSAAGLALHGDIDAALTRFWNDTRERHKFLQHDPDRPILAPHEIYLRPEDFYTLGRQHAQLVLRGGAAAAAELNAEGAGASADDADAASGDSTAALAAAATAASATPAWARALPELAVERGAEQVLRRFEAQLRSCRAPDARAQPSAAPPRRLLLVAESAGRRESLLDFLREHHLDVPPVDGLAAFLNSDHAYA